MNINAQTELSLGKIEILPDASSYTVTVRNEHSQSIKTFYDPCPERLTTMAKEYIDKLRQMQELIKIHETI